MLESRAMVPGLSLISLLVGLSLRPYVPPTLDPEPAFTPSQVAVVEIVPEGEGWDANVYARPIYTSPLVGNIARGTRVRVRGELRLPYAPYCRTSMYYAVEPFGWVCSADTQRTYEAVTTEPVLSLVDDTPVPYRYVMVTVEEGSFVPMWSSLQALTEHLDPERALGRGDTIALAAGDKPRIVEIDGESYYVTIDDKVLPVTGTMLLKNFSDFQGVELPADTHFPFGWAGQNKVPVFDAPKGKRVGELARRERVDILGEEGEGRARYLKIGEGRYVRADRVNEVRVMQRPEGTGAHAQWIDVDLGEQVVVAYANDRPVYATLTSSGRPPNSTPRGNYPVWGKATTISMKSQEYDDAPYYVDRVPWVMFFQAHNALHAAYWHDRFGAVKSHGCANLSPRDARYLFDWLEPTLPAGWTAVRYWNLTEAPVVHVRNSQRVKPFAQERNIGPPDKEDEAKRLEEALVRREQKALEEAALMQSAPVVVPLLPATAPAPLLFAPAPAPLAR